MLTEAENHVIKHALGLTGRGGRGRTGRRWAYRNYFAAGDKDVAVWTALVARGLACTLRPVGPEACSYPGFAVTAAGVEAAGLTAYVSHGLLPNREGKIDG